MPRLDLDKPRYDQSNFEGRLRHFWSTTNPLNVLATDAQLEKAKQLVVAYRKGEEPEGVSDDEVWAAKELYDSAFHPDTGEKLFLPGRMSFQVPGNMCITGAMMTFFRTTPAVVFWQWTNQSFNAVVNYTNRNASAGITNEQLMQAYAGATGASLVTAVGLNKLIASSPALSQGIVGRLVPMVAVAAANCVNIPLMRQREVLEGIDVQDADGVTIGKSKEAAKESLFQVVPSRILMAMPAMFVPPVIMQRLERTALLKSRPLLKAPFTILLTGAMLTFSTPFCCAIFPQVATLPLERLEPEVQAAAKAKGLDKVFFNKGL